ncbi:MAG: DUF4288 domain-containing protein [Armatimonadota bacterium]|nr:DUF4288 domain-containing protein [Armatimonadota bacterium]MDW8028493.1 DUF4288 domain-containing protein [Armatimonadota bacterium]MDW8142348.1 DUF4288 domain-containing protein [Armatimonadota bacterium]
MLFVVSLLFQRQYKSQENCQQPKILKVSGDFVVQSSRLQQGISHLMRNLDKAQTLLNHYAGFAERYGGVLKGIEVSSWQDVEEHTPHGFLAHLAGLGLNEQELKDAADLLFAFHFALAEKGACNWKPNVAEWRRSVREVLSLFEERFVLVEAVSEENAWSEAERLGKEQEVIYINPYGDEVMWRFVKVNEVIKVDGEHGSEIFSRFLNSREAASLLQRNSRNR